MPKSVEDIIGPSSDLTLEVDQGAFVDAPVWSTHKNAKNWAAIVIELAPKFQGGINREFFEHASGIYRYYVPDHLVPGTPVEFGADVDNSKNRVVNRWYGVVTEVAADHVSFHKCADAREAVELSESMIEEQGGPGAAPPDALVDALSAISAAEQALADGDKHQLLEELDRARTAIKDRQRGAR